MSITNYVCKERDNLEKNLRQFVEENKKLLFNEKVKIYEFAIEMTNSVYAMMDLAVLYENCEDYKNAEKYYLRALKFEQNCPIIYYNLADMYLTMSKKEEDLFHKQYALQYFAKGADLNDIQCMFRYIYTAPVDCEKSKGYLSKAIEHPKYKSERCSSFAGIISMVILLGEMEEPFAENVANEKKRLNSIKDVSIYKNKVQLFKKLNHVCECPVCYDEKLNIDLKCGHCFCDDCYVKIIDDDLRCPICRN